jgi:hypothetical protein
MSGKLKSTAFEDGIIALIFVGLVIAAVGFLAFMAMWILAIILMGLVLFVIPVVAPALVLGGIMSAVSRSACKAQN